MVTIASSVAESIVDDVLSANEEILSISIMNSKGYVLATKSKEDFKEAFGLTQDGDKYGVTLAVSALAIANEVREVAGEAQALITIYKKCKMMLLPVPSYEILIGLVLQHSVNAEDYNITDKMEKLLADAIKSDNSETF